MEGGTGLESGDDNASVAAEEDSLQTRIVQSAEQVANSTSATHISCSPAADADADVERLETSPLARLRHSGAPLDALSTEAAPARHEKTKSHSTHS